MDYNTLGVNVMPPILFNMSCSLNSFGKMSSLNIFWMNEEWMKLSVSCSVNQSFGFIEDWAEEGA